MRRLSEAQRQGHKTLAITNRAESTMAVEADVSMPLAAGVEKAIPATKSFTCQLAVLYLLALYEGARLGRMDAADARRTSPSCAALPGALESQLDGWREQARRARRANTPSPQRFSISAAAFTTPSPAKARSS